MHPQDIRQEFLKIRDQPRERDEKIRNTPETVLARAAAILSGEYAVVRNVFDEMDKRLGSSWREGGVVDVSGSLGAGMW